MDTTETTRLRALCERAALPACEAQHMRDDGAWCVVAAQGERRAIIAEVTWALPEPLASDRVTAARAKLYAEAPAAIPALCDTLDARDRGLAAVTAHRDQLVADAAATAARMRWICARSAVTSASPSARASASSRSRNTSRSRSAMWARSPAARKRSPTLSVGGTQRVHRTPSQGAVLYQIARSIACAPISPSGCVTA